MCIHRRSIMLITNSKPICSPWKMLRTRIIFKSLSRFYYHPCLRPFSVSIALESWSSRVYAESWLNSYAAQGIIRSMPRFLSVCFSSESPLGSLESLANYTFTNHIFPIDRSMSQLKMRRREAVTWTLRGLFSMHSHKSTYTCRLDIRYEYVFQDPRKNMRSNTEATTSCHDCMLFFSHGLLYIEGKVCVHIDGTEGNFGWYTQW